MTRGNKPRIQYNPVFRDSSSNYPFEDIFLYDNYIPLNHSVHQNSNGTNLPDEGENEKEKEKELVGCFYSFNKIIVRIVGYFIDSK